MTIVMARQRAKQRKIYKSKLRALDEAIWKGIQGIWKNKIVDPVAYQRKLRQEADSDVV